mmetsp:Transcript_29438/g.62493  ORF Transcript_29438/g.62493 Transcript_29438/m.62493 type:complete len:222 (+) Transcript_29438:112-777(+)|eukprot:CAMPEP_0172314078 /NCGR_PEP_ID=MMETSP1058-20130122/21600_1 /TAXON_ID=83371 /ORGANISM="Detonula confervacea, Strain CCMP 353" /LENGTH=221 /DNA_ID=CAMNT_0013027839 /DNA_START=85 /DNA_END=750 /DNA_ORIENTATION=-
MAGPSALYSILVSIFAATAFLLAWAAEFGCAFISFTSTSGFNQPITVKFGIWTYQFWTIATSVGGSVIFETCHSYPSTVHIDSNWKAARAFSTLAVVFGGIFLFANLITACTSPLRRTSRAEAPAFIVACFFQGLALLLLNSAACNDNSLVRHLQKDVANLGNTEMEFPDTCSISTGAKCTISAIVFWFLAAMASTMSLRAEKKEEENNVITEPLIPGENL